MDWTWVSCEVGGVLYFRWIPTEPPGKPKALKKKSIQLSKIFAKLIFTLNNRLSVQFSHSVMSDSLRPCGLQHTRLPCPSQLRSWWCHPTISSSVVLFSFCLPCFPASGSFQMSQLFASVGQIIEVSASTSVLPMNIQDWFPLGWTGLISLQSKELSRVFSNTTAQKQQFFSAQLSL